MFLILRKVLLPTIEFGIKIAYEIVENESMNQLIYVSLHFMQAIPDFYFSELAQKKKQGKEPTQKALVNLQYNNVVVNVEY